VRSPQRIQPPHHHEKAKRNELDAKAKQPNVLSEGMKTRVRVGIRKHLSNFI
jgi:hypothetical protein